MKCNFIKADGERCQAHAMKGSEFCFLHNPAVPDEVKQRAWQEGGKNRVLAVRGQLPPIEINRPEDAVSVLTDTIKRVREGSLDIRVANCLGVLCGHLLKAYEVTNLDNRLALFERVVLTKRG